MDPRNIVITEIGKVIELGHNGVKVNGTVPAGRVFVPLSSSRMSPLMAFQSQWLARWLFSKASMATVRSSSISRCFCQTDTLL